MKKLINQPEDLVPESLAGMALAHPDIIRAHFDPNFLSWVEAPAEGKVAVISGGGSGHEPMHGGFVGRGMLTAACPGAVFTSPSPDQIIAAAQAVNSGCGVLNIVKNYSGDIMNFQMAAEMLMAEGIPVDNIIIDDDVGIREAKSAQGRRGVGTTVLAEKICGAAADAGYSLAAVAAIGRRVNRNGRSMGVALGSCTVPARGMPTFELGEDEMEVGIGIHGEPGWERRSLVTADAVTELLARAIIDDPAYTRPISEWDAASECWVDVEVTSEPFRSGDRVLALVNGLGGTPLAELYIIYRKLEELCRASGLEIVRRLVGSYVTSLEMPGCAITLLRLDDAMIELWDRPVMTPALRWGV